MSRKLITITMCILLAACNMPGQTPSTEKPQAWFDMPLPDTVFYPPNPCQIIVHGASSSGIATFEISTNGVVASTNPMPDSKEDLATLKTACPTLVPGKNIIEVRVKDNSGLWSDPTQTIVFLAGNDNNSTCPTVTATVSPTPAFQGIITITPTITRVTSPRATESPTPAFQGIITITPTFTPVITSTSQTSTGISIERISTNLVYLGDASCGTREITFTVRATTPNGIKVVVLFYRFQTVNSTTEFQSITLNPIGSDLYERTLNPTSLLGGAIPFDQATLQYQIVVQQNNDDTSLRTPVLSDIAVQACGRVTTACSSYTDERTCIANGCSWVNIPGTVPIFECRSP